MTPQEENIRLQQQVNEELKAYNEAQRKATKETEKSAEVEAKVAGLTATGLQIMEKLYNAQLKYTLAMAKGQKGASQFNDGIDAMTEATQIAAVALSLLVPGGALIKGVTAGLTFLATQAMKTAAEMQKAANDQADATYKAFQAFSKAGATGADGLKGFFDDVNRMRLNVNQLDAMAGAIANSAKELTAMGGSVYRGRKEFANLVEGLGDFEKGMLNLGMNYDDQAEAVLGYMKIQSNITRGQQQDYGKLSKSARQYIEETEVLTRVTGLNRKQQEEVLDRQMSSQRSGARLQELANEGNTKAVELLQGQVKIYAKMGPAAEQGYNDILSGNVNTAAAIKLMTATQGKVMQDQNDIIEGRVTSEREAMSATQGTAKVMGQMQTDMLGLFKAGVGEEILLPFKEMTEANKIAAGNLSESVDDARDQVNKLTGNVDGADSQLTRYTNLIKEQNDQMLALQQSLNGSFSSAGISVGGFTEILDRAANLIFDVAKKALEMLGLMDAGKEREARLGKELSDSEMSGSAGEVGLAATQGAEAMTSAPKAEDIRSAKDLGFIDRMFVGEENVKKRIELENKGMTPAQAAEEIAKSQGRIPATAINKNLSTTGETTSPAGAAAGPPTSFSVDKLLNYIGMKEARGQYDMLVGGKTKSDLTSMSVADVMKFQGTMIKNGHETTAVGKYQILYDTLAGLVRNGVLKPGDMFNSGTQDRAAIALLKEKGMDAYVSGKMSKEQFADRVAKVWASMPLASGKGAYDGVGSNKAIGSRAEYLAAFARDGGIFDGPKSGYAATLHGMEAVIPLKNGAVPVSMSQEFNMTAANLGELVAILKSNTGMQDRMLAVLEDIKRSQSSTADNTSRMAAVASN
jgi:muramidase (phage lysozyme)